MLTYHLPARTWHGLPLAPTTRLGSWAVLSAVVSGVAWLAAVPVVVLAPSEGVWLPWGVLLLVTLVPASVCAIAASILAFLAMARRGERALSVYLGYVPVACILLASWINSLFFTS